MQFRFDNGIWNAHQRKRGVEVTVEGKTPRELKITPNHHYNGTFLEPWGERSQRGYGIEVIRRFFEEVAYVEFGGPPALQPQRLRADAGAGVQRPDAPTATRSRSCRRWRPSLLAAPRVSRAASSR